MKNKVYLTFCLTLFVSFFFSCNYNKNIEEVEIEEDKEDTYNYDYFENSVFYIDYNPDINMNYWLKDFGDSLVFRYRYTKPAVENIPDTYYSESILFQIDPNLNEFSFTDEEDLLKSKIVLSIDCFCGFDPESWNMSFPPKGVLSGKKISANQWEIKIDVTFYGDQKRTLENVFTLK